jgi:hypothetical protein
VLLGLSTNAINEEGLWLTIPYFASMHTVMKLRKCKLSWTNEAITWAQAG